MTDLLPCPFCGCKAIYVTHTHYYDDEDTVCVFCNGCKAHVIIEQNEAEGISDKTKAEAVAAWNSRADYHGYEQAAIEAWESVKAWNSRAERTCKPVEKDGVMRCPDCDYPLGIMSVPAYCAGCGAKVVSE